MAAEKPAPSRKKIERPIRTPMSSAGSASSATKAMAAKMPSVRNWRVR